MTAAEAVAAVPGIQVALKASLAMVKGTLEAVVAAVALVAVMAMQILRE